MTDDVGDSRDDEYPRDEDAFREFIDGPRDVFVCASCGSKAYRTYPDEEPGAFYAEVDGESAIVCYDCDDNYDWSTIESRIRARRKATQRSPIGEWVANIRAAVRPVTSHIPVPFSIHDVEPKRRSSLVAEHSVFVGRLSVFLGLVTVVLIGVGVFAAVTGALLVSPGAGTEWFTATIVLYREWALFLLSSPGLVLGVLGLGYLVHLVEYQRHVKEVDLDHGRTRPRWHYLALFSGAGLVGWFAWVLSQFTVVPPVFLPVGVVTWSASTIALVYFLHYTLLEDRWSYGLRIQAGLWKFPAQFGVGLVLFDGVIGLPGPEPTTYAIASVPPIVGVLYASRRYLAFTERWARITRRFQRVSYRLRQVLPGMSWSIFETPDHSSVTSQFGQATDLSSEQSGRRNESTGIGDAEKEPRQSRGWLSFLTSKLNDREERMEDLEATLAQVSRELRDARQADSGEASASRTRDNLLADLFEIRDNFRRALDAETEIHDDQTGALREGVELIDRQIKSILEREGVEEIDTSGEVDPTKHRVVETVPATDADAGTIVDVYQLGYRQGDRILREADVVVAEHPTAGNGTETNDGSGLDRGDDAS